MWSTPSLSSLSCPLWSGVVASDRVLSMDRIELNCVLMLNWIAWNRTVLTFNLRTYAKLNCLKWNCFCMITWIVWNRAVYMYKNGFGINNLQWLMCHKTKPDQTKLFSFFHQTWSRHFELGCLSHVLVTQ